MVCIIYEKSKQALLRTTHDLLWKKSTYKPSQVCLLSTYTSMNEKLNYFSLQTKNSTHQRLGLVCSPKKFREMKTIEATTTLPAASTRIILSSDEASMRNSGVSGSPSIGSPL